MVKQSTTKNGMARIRFIMLDAEIPEGDLSQITSAIQNALKPTTTIVHQRISSNSAQVVANRTSEDMGSIENENMEDEAEEEVANQKPAKAARSRKPTTPEVIEFDFTSGVSLKDFTEEHPTANNEAERCIVIAAWFKEHRATSSVTTAHIYTGYRVVGWSTGLEDFGWPLRYLKSNKLMSRSARGSFDINHLGLDKVKKLRISK